MKAIKETEKAVQINATIENDLTERVKKVTVWIPKSQIRDGRPTAWILQKKREELTALRPGCFVTFTDANGDTVTAKEAMPVSDVALVKSALRAMKVHI